MKGETLTEKILETVISLVATSADLFVVIIESGYGASYRQMRRKLQGVPDRSPRKSTSIELGKEKKNFYSFLYELQKDGLIERKRGKWFATRIGKEKYKKLLAQLPLRRYKKQVDPSLKIVIFDIPEREKEKRFWLRDRLRELGFRMLQKSVWEGKIKIPQEFIEDLRAIGLIQYVEIFAVTKTGSLRLLKQ